MIELHKWFPNYVTYENFEIVAETDLMAAD